MGKPIFFKTRHIKVEFRPPDDKKQLDMNDPFDVEEAKKLLWSEWKMIEEDVKKAFKIVVIDGKAYIDPEQEEENHKKFLLP